jgi:hypothetical protein
MPMHAHMVGVALAMVDCAMYDGPCVESDPLKPLEES